MEFFVSFIKCMIMIVIMIITGITPLILLDYLQSKA